MISVGSIGGAFELDLKDVVGATAPPPLPTGTESVTSGRTALSLVAQRLQSAGFGGRWLVPAYLCPSVLQPLREARVEIELYGVGTQLQPDAGLLLRTIERDPPAVLLVIDYFGFPPADADALSALRDACTIVEDCVHGSLLELPDPAAGRIGDVAFTSFRKYLPLPDGGVLVGSSGDSLPPAAIAAVAPHLLGQLLRGAFGAGELSGDHIERAFLDLLARGDRTLDGRVPYEAMSEVSRTLLARIDLPEVAERRRRNFRALASLLAPDARWAPLFDCLPAGVSPLVYPLRIFGGRRDAVRAALAAQRIYCPVHWVLPAEIDRARFPDEHRLADEILGLPIDQRYEEEHMKRSASAFATALGHAP